MDATTAAEESTASSVDEHVKAAAAAANYEEGFGISDCDLERSDLWAVYTRQGTEE